MRLYRQMCEHSYKKCIDVSSTCVFNKLQKGLSAHTPTHKSTEEIEKVLYHTISVGSLLSIIMYFVKTKKQ